MKGKTMTLFTWSILIGLAICHEYFFVRGLVDFGRNAGWWY